MSKTELSEKHCISYEACEHETQTNFVFKPKKFSSH